MRTAGLSGAILEAVMTTPKMGRSGKINSMRFQLQKNFWRRVYEFYLGLGISKDFTSRSEAG